MDLAGSHAPRDSPARIYHCAPRWARFLPRPLSTAKIIDGDDS